MVTHTPHPPALHPAPKTGGIPPVSLGSLWRAIRRYSVLVVAFALLAATAGVLTYWFIPVPKMTASTIYYVSATPPAVLNTPFDSRVDFSMYKQQQQAILRSRQVINVTLATPSVTDLPMLDRDQVADPAQYLMKNLNIDFGNGPEYMRVSLEGNDGDQLVAILKALNASYMKQAVDKDKNRRLARLDQLKKLQENYFEELRRHRSRIRKVMESVGSGDPYTLSVRERFLEGQIGAAQTQLTNIESVILQNGVDSAVATEALAKPLPEIPEALLNDFVQLQPEYAQLAKERARVAADIEANIKALQPGVKSPAVERLEFERDRMDRELKLLPDKLKPQILSKYKEGAAKTQQQKLSDNQSKMTTLSKMQQALKLEIDRLINTRKDLNGNTLELENLRDDVIQTEKMANRITTDIEELKPELDAPTRVTLWEEPAATPGVEGSRRAKYTGMAAGGVLLLGLALVQFLDIRNRRVHTVEDVAAGTGLTVLGSMPRYPRAGRDDSGAWNHLLAESINTTRTMILAPRGAYGQAPPPVARTILVTSASSGEGKTSLTTHLAVSLANAGRRVLLIDADMRRPAAHAVLDVPLTPGLSEYLTKGLTAEDASQECQVPGLTVVAAGKWNDASAAALNGVRWRDLLAQAAEGYDFVLIDSPPILPVADALSIARHVDGVLISVMQDHSRYMAVQAACNRLSLVGARMLGVVMAGATAQSGHYYYDRYYSAYKAEPAVAE